MQTVLGVNEASFPLPMNPKMVERTPHPGPLPIGSADSADAEREKRSQRLGDVLSWVAQGFNARIFREIPTLARSLGEGELRSQRR